MNIPLISICWIIVFAACIVASLAFWLEYRRRLGREEEVNATGVHWIRYREGRAVFYKLIDRAFTELENGNRSTAKELFEQFIKLEPNNAIGYVGLGQYYYDENLLEAERYFQQAYDLDPKLIFPLLILGNIEYLHKRFDKAIDYFEKAITLERNLPEVCLGLARCYDSLNNTKKALKYYKKFLRLAHTSLDVTEVHQRVSELSHHEDSET